jgi:hypothetical protein
MLNPLLKASENLKENLYPEKKEVAEVFVVMQNPHGFRKRVAKLIIDLFYATQMENGADPCGKLWTRFVK